ncbi:MAG TPA: hypothetical protein VK163_11030 [Opitutaceae bacterium]|nr:hypothetical protein [Opitutaceae bacterium]
MSTNVQAVINAAADEADNLLEGVLKPADARPLLLEWLGGKYPGLTQSERDAVVAEVLSVLEREEFFEVAFGDDNDDPPENGEPDE